MGPSASFARGWATGTAKSGLAAGATPTLHTRGPERSSKIPPCEGRPLAQNRAHKSPGGLSPLATLDRACLGVALGRLACYRLAKGCCKTPFSWVGAWFRLHGVGCTLRPCLGYRACRKPRNRPGSRYLARWSAAIQPRGSDAALWQQRRLENARFRRCGVGLTGRSFPGRRGSGERGQCRFSPRAHRPLPAGDAPVAVHASSSFHLTESQPQTHSQAGKGSP